jgi:hypothetical protein
MYVYVALFTSTSEWKGVYPTKHIAYWMETSMKFYFDVELTAFTNANRPAGKERVEPCSNGP